MNGYEWLLVCVCVILCSRESKRCLDSLKTVHPPICSYSWYIVISLLLNQLPLHYIWCRGKMHQFQRFGKMPITYHCHVKNAFIRALFGNGWHSKSQKGLVEIQPKTIICGKCNQKPCPILPSMGLIRARIIPNWLIPGSTMFLPTLSNLTSR